MTSRCHDDVSAIIRLKSLKSRQWFTFLVNSVFYPLLRGVFGVMTLRWLKKVHNWRIMSEFNLMTTLSVTSFMYQSYDCKESLDFGKFTSELSSQIYFQSCCEQFQQGMSVMEWHWKMQRCRVVLRWMPFMDNIAIFRTLLVRILFMFLF